jgi:hypothetical protein
MPLSAKETLVAFLKDNVFKPALVQHVGSIGGRDPKLPRSVQERVRRTQIRNENYSSAGEVRQNFISGLQSEAGKKMSSDMAALRMKTFEEVEATFRTLSRDLGI